MQWNQFLISANSYSRHETGLAGGTEDSLPGAAGPWM